MAKMTWERHWQENNIGWDLAGNHPLLGDLIELATPFSPAVLTKRGSVLVPGAGSGHDAAYFAKLGFKVLHNDIVPKAVEFAQQKYSGIKGLNFNQDDFFKQEDSWSGKFDIIFDRAFFCAFDTDNHQDHVKCLTKYLKKNGLFLGILFSEISYKDNIRNGPPFDIAPTKFHELMKEEFDLCAVEERTDGATDLKIIREFLCVYKKK